MEAVFYVPDDPEVRLVQERVHVVHDVSWHVEVHGDPEALEVGPSTEQLGADQELEAALVLAEARDCLHRSHVYWTLWQRTISSALW